MTLFRWSKSEPSNDTADLAVGGIDWREGQAPSTINNSGRGMMAAVAKYRDDIAGRLVTTGSSTAYTINPTNQVFTSLVLMDGAMIAFVPHVTCSSPLTLNVDALGAKPLRTAPSVEVQAGQLIAGTPYAATYSNSTAVWTLQNILGNFTGAVPIGSVIPYAGTTAPNSNFALCFGQSIATASFPALFAILSYTYGGAGANFNVPDMRGRVAAGQDDMGGSTGSTPIGTITTGTGTINGATLGSFGGTSSHTINTTQMPSHSHSITDVQHSHSYTAPSATTGTQTIGGNGNTATVAATTGTSFTGITGTQATGGGAAIPILQPTIILNHIIRVL